MTRVLAAPKTSWAWAPTSAADRWPFFQSSAPPLKKACCCRIHRQRLPLSRHFIRQSVGVIAPLAMHINFELGLFVCQEKFLLLYRLEFSQDADVPGRTQRREDAAELARGGPALCAIHRTGMHTFALANPLASCKHSSHAYLGSNLRVRSLSAASTA